MAAADSLSALVYTAAVKELEEHADKEYDLDTAFIVECSLAFSKRIPAIAMDQILQGGRLSTAGREQLVEFALGTAPQRATGDPPTTQHEDGSGPSANAAANLAAADVLMAMVEEGCMPSLPAPLAPRQRRQPPLDSNRPATRHRPLGQTREQEQLQQRRQQQRQRQQRQRQQALSTTRQRSEAANPRTGRGN